MEISEVTSSVKNALTALEQMQRMTALNIANANKNVLVNKSFDMSQILSELSKTTGVYSSDDVVSFTESLSKANSGEVRLDQEVMTSGQISGKYKNIVEAYNRQLALYQLALGKGK